MTEPAFTKGPFFLATVGAQTQAPATLPTLPILDSAVWLRTKPIASGETLPLYANGATDFTAPATSDITTWYVENAPQVFEADSRGLFNVAGNGLENEDDQFGQLVSSAGFAISSQDATFFYVFEPGVSTTSNAFEMARFNGHFSISLVVDGAGTRILVTYRRGSSGTQRFNYTADLGPIENSKFNVVVKVSATNVIAYVNGTEEINVSTSGDYSSLLQESSFFGFTTHPLFFARWVGADQPTVAEIQSTLVPLI